MFSETSQAEVAKWLTALCLLRVARMDRGSSPEPPPMLVDMFASMWIKKARLPCWPPYSKQVSHQRWIWGSHKWKGMQGAHPGFDVARSPKQWYQWPHKRTSEFVFFKKNFSETYLKKKTKNSQKSFKILTAKSRAFCYKLYKNK